MAKRAKIIRFPGSPGEPAKRPPGIDEQDLVEVRRCRHEAEALVVKSLLDSEEIPSVLRSRLAHSVHPFTVGDQGEVIVLFAADKVEPNFYRPEHIKWLSLFGEQAALALQNARLFEAARQQAVELEVVRQANLTLTSHLALPNVLDAILRSTLEVLPTAQDAHIFLYDGVQLAFGAALWADGQRLTQSLAILEFLEETHPEPPLLPADPFERAYVRSLALDIACEIHPLNNLRVLKYLVHVCGVEEAQKSAWYRHWVEQGLAVVEDRLKNEGRAGRFCFGDQPGLADCVLIPQVFNAQRFKCRTEHVPNVMRVFDACMKLDAFSKTQPSACPDAA